MTGVILIGLVAGGVYALSALSLVSIYRGSGVLNLAMGAFAAWGGYLFAHLRDDRGVPTFLAILLTLVLEAVAGAVVYLLFIRPIRRAPDMQKLIMTLGVMTVLTGLLGLAFGHQIRSVGPIIGTGTVSLLGSNIAVSNLLMLGVTLVLAGALGLWSAWGRLPLATRALSENEAGVQALGYSPHLLGAMNWALGGVLAGMSGILLAPVLGLAPASLSMLLVPALAAAVIGRFESYGWAVAGGLFLGVVQALITRYGPGGGLDSIVPLVMVLVALLVRRNEGSNRPVATETLRLSRPMWPVDVVLLVVVGLFVASGDIVWANAAIVSMTLGIVALSLVLITGWANQISLAQLMIAGLAGLVSVHVFLALSVPFIVLPLVGAVVGGVVGIVIGIPALRLSGLNLAVVTIVASVAVERVVFASSATWLSGGNSGLFIPSISVFGQDITPLLNPQNYGWVVLAWLAAVVGLLHLIRRSRFGSAMLAVRSNARIAAASGINVTRTKILTFALSAAIAGVGGVLMAFSSSVFTMTAGFGYLDSINLLAVLILAGATSLRGGLVAGVAGLAGIAYVAVSDFGWVSSNYGLISGVALVLTILLHPHGFTYARPRRVGGAELPDAASETRSPSGLELVDVRVEFGGVTAVSDVRLSFEQGTVTGLVGPNGAGKTTLLDAVCGFVPASGSARVGGQELIGASPHRRAHAGVARVFQGVELIDELSVAQNVSLPRAAGLGGSGTPSCAAAWADRAGLTSGLDAPPTTLGLGSRKHVGVVRALMADPAVVLLDEPGAGMGPNERAALVDCIRDLSRGQGRTVVLVDHDMALIRNVCDVVHVLVGGRVIASGPPNEVLANERVRAAYLGTDGDHSSPREEEEVPR
ncbi:ATP-binding cassette domain-containing protein (plasmid) [Rhodococcus sp. USK10]|uniref:ABC transporter permease subunit n=1 Tax=Rhodococcus sp. USK10 TaxID=2789739 RepID=UPI001C5F801E|nr:ATP-binding cassette domain-containing protein [Rhodococcus sp. USK10]QYB00291.1 ATP-binding cassette domain-containing protein [Rhodococcus sp. USK10]